MPEYEEPVYGEITEKMWARLPQYYRTVDGANGYRLKTFMASMAHQLDEIKAVLDRIDYDDVADGGGADDTSDLVDPAYANIEWLPWLGQIYGLPGVTATDTSRQLMMSRGVVGMAGTSQAIEAAAKSALVGTRYVRFYPRSTAIGVAGGLWDGVLVTRESDTLENNLPEYVSAGSSSSVYGVVGHDPSVVVDYALLSNEHNPDFYNGAAMCLAVESVEPVGPANLTLPLAYTMSVDGGELFNFIYSAGSDTARGPISATLTFDTGDTLTGATGNIGAGAKAMGSVQGTAPAGATSATVVFTIPNVVSGDRVYFGELADRKEPSTEWILKSANPVAAVIEAGEKPAGMILHHKTFASTWDTIEANSPTWNDWEKTWTAIEEQ